VLADMSGHDAERLRQLIQNHHLYTGSSRAKEILDGWSEYRHRFVKVMPVEYRRALRDIARAQGLASVAAE
jgi:glutamate synthase (NADPH/NADH) large chain